MSRFVRHYSRAIVGTLGLALAGAAFPQEYFSLDNLVPSPWYLSSDWAQFSGGTSLRLPAIQILGGRTVPPPDPDHPVTATFDFVGTLETQPGPPNIYSVPGQGMALYLMPQGPPQMPFDTEMLMLNLSGGNLPAGMFIRESPTRKSLGQTSIRDVTGGYMVDSFFDVFFELSTDGGQSWLPAIQSVRMVGAADPVPEPASLAVVGLALVALKARRRRQ